MNRETRDELVSVVRRWNEFLGNGGFCNPGMTASVNEDALRTLVLDTRDLLAHLAAQEAQLRERDDELRLNATMLAKQCDLARDAETQLAAQVAAFGAVQAQHDRLRAALVGLVGVDGRSELEQLEAAMRLMPAPAEDKAATSDAIHALIASAPREPIV